jgi:hypothetical protein
MESIDMDKPVDWTSLSDFFHSVEDHLDSVPESERRAEVFAIGKKVRALLLNALEREFA